MPYRIIRYASRQSVPPCLGKRRRRYLTTEWDTNMFLDIKRCNFASGIQWTNFQCATTIPCEVIAFATSAWELTLGTCSFYGRYRPGDVHLAIFGSRWLGWFCLGQNQFETLSEGEKTQSKSACVLLCSFVGFWKEPKGFVSKPAKKLEIWEMQRLGPKTPNVEVKKKRQNWKRTMKS